MSMRPRPILSSDGQHVRVDPDVPKPGPCCAPGTVRELCDTCWPVLRDYALAKGIPAHSVGQLRGRMYRMSPEEVAAANFKLYPVQSRSIELAVMAQLEAKAAAIQAL
jgi:hypothetical protein